MVSRIFGFRWVETGCEVWQLEREPRRFYGCVGENADGTWSWNTAGVNPYGEARNKRDAMIKVEQYAG